MKIVAICFSDESMIETRKRYVLELKSKDLFNEVIEFSPLNLKGEFMKRHQQFINDNKKGYGFYIWKPYIILEALKNIDEGDILVYGDAGNDVPGTRSEMLEKILKVKEIDKGVKIMASKQGWGIRWIKSDLYIAMGVKSFLYAFKRMVEAGRVVMIKNSETMKFVEEWLYYATADYRNIDNSPSRFPNLPFFIQHRNDQSIFTLLFHKYKGTIVDFGDVWRASRIRHI